MQKIVLSAPFRRAAEIEAAPALVRALLRPGGIKPHGAARAAEKAAKVAFKAARQANIALPGVLRLGNGAPLPVDFRNTAYLDYANRAAGAGYEPELSLILDVLAPRLRTLYDIGANWGYFIALLAGAPDFAGAVHAFEIAPRTQADTLRAIAASGLDATLHRFGLSDSDGHLRIAEGLHSVLTRIDPEGGAIVAVRRLDNLDLPPPDFIKIDVEGHEAAVLRGAENLLRTAKPIVAFESWHDDAPEAMAAPLLHLERLGYRCCDMLWRDAQGGLSHDPPSVAPGTLRTLILRPLSAADRAAIPQALNLLAIHPENTALLSA